MRNMRLLPLLLFPLLSLPCLAQSDAPPVKLFERHDEAREHASTPVIPADTPATDTVLQRAPGDVEIQLDAGIERLMEQHAEFEHTRNGFRVQIYLGDRRTAEEKRRDFMLKYPEIPAYISWLAPNFRLRVGDLCTRLEAEELLERLKTEHPGSYIVPDEIVMSGLAKER